MTVGGGVLSGVTGMDPRSTLGPPTSREGALIGLTGIAVEVQHTPVLRNLDLHLDSGAAVGIMGANGSGKTTLLQLAATLLRPVAGTGAVLGADLHERIPVRVRRAICLVGHQAAVYPQLTLRENLAFAATLLGRPAKDVDAALETVGLTRAAHRRADRCSQGMIRRADLARALIGRPQLLLLDEPHTGLDASAAELVEVLVAEVRGRGGGAVVVSHDRGRLDPLVDEVLELTAGRLVPAGSGR